MRPNSGRFTVATSLLLSFAVCLFANSSLAQDAESRDVPPALAPFEFLVGRWKGQGVPKDNPTQRFRGWTETHTWAWIFSKGKPEALALSIDGGKVLARATLRFDAKAKAYLLESKSVGDSSASILYVGILDASGKLLTLEKSGVAAGSTAERLSLRANSNYLRYTLNIDRREPGAVQFNRAIEVGLTKEGESFAAGSASIERSKCIVTGGAASMTVNYQGQSYPICCTGCRDEFNENPEKYLRKLSLISKGDGASKKPAAPASKVSRFEDAFSGDVDSSGGSAPRKMPGESEKTSKPSADIGEPVAKTTPKGEVKTGRKAAPRGTETPPSRAVTLLKLGQNLERGGKNTAALKYYKQVAKDFPGTPSARTASERIKALETP